MYLAMCIIQVLCWYDVCLQLHYQNDQAQVVLGERANGTVVLPQGNAQMHYKEDERLKKEIWTDAICNDV